MDFPLNISLGGRDISTHLITEIAGIFLGYRFYLFLRKRSSDRISDENRLKIFAAACVGALFGSRLIGILEDPYLLMNSSNKWVYIFSNKTIVGGLLGGLVAVELFKKRLKIIISSGDLMVYPLIFGMFIGRIGCFCEGLNDGVMGSETSLFTGIDFGDGKLRHPLPLYEMTFLLCLTIVLIQLDRKKILTDGAKFKLFLISYFIYRFMNEFMKDRHFTILHLSVIQITCLIGLVYYLPTISSPKKLFIKNA